MELRVPITVELDEGKIRKIVDDYIEEHDVVEVVRCKDCTHYRICGLCAVSGLIVDDDFFCKWGEKE